MKLKRILSGFLAGAVALSSMLFSSVTASAATPVATVTTSAGYEAQNLFGTGADMATVTKFVLNVTFDSTDGANGKFFLNVGGGTNAEVLYATDGSATLTVTPGETYDIELPVADTINQWYYIIMANAYWGSFDINSIKAYSGTELINVTPAPEAPYDGTLLTLASNPPYNWQGMEAFTVADFSASTVQDVLDNVGELKVSFDINGADASSFTDYASGNYTDYDYSQISYQVRIGSSEWIVAGSSVTEGNKVTITVTAADLAEALAGKTLTEAFTGFEIVAGAATDSSNNPIRLFHNDVTATVTAPVNAYTITIADTENGTVVAKVGGVEATEAEEDATVALEVTPDAGYALDTLAVTGASGDVTLTEDNTFLMPAEDVTVTATFVAVPTYTITIADTENGTVEADVTTAKEGDTVTVTATPDKGYELDSIQVTCEDANVVPPTVTGNTFTMPASNVKVSATFAEIEVEEITISPANIPSLLAGSTVQLTAEITPEDALDKDVTWKSSDDSIATVSSTGLVTGVAEGTVTITAASANGVKGTATIKVTTNEIPATAITLSKTALTLEEGASETITATVTPEDSTDMVIWDSSDPSVATVVNGKITAIKEGKTTIIATAGAVTAECIVTVEAKPEATGYDKVEANFEADTIVAQKATNADGTTNVRIVKMVKEADIYDKDTVTFTLKNKAGTVKTVTSKNYYMSLVASGNKVTPKDGYVFLAITVTDIPEGEEVTCTDITLS